MEVGPKSLKKLLHTPAKTLHFSPLSHLVKSHPYPFEVFLNEGNKFCSSLEIGGLFRCVCLPDAAAAYIETHGP